MKYLILLALLFAPAETYHLWIATGVPVDASTVHVEGFGYEDVTVTSSGQLVTVRWTAERACFDVRVSGPRVVGRSTHLEECDKTALPLVLGP
jgi:hypothetical protein